jgi:hypothetical protein
LITNHGPGELVQVFDKAEMTFVKVQVQFFWVFGFGSPRNAPHSIWWSFENGHRDFKQVFELEEVW